MTVPSLLVLGTDAVLAAAPATPVQLAHACLAAGYHAVVPASWGDELIASRSMDRLRDADGPLVQCSCPYVTRRLAAHGDTLSSMLLTCVSPPVATARYLRALYAPGAIRVTYAGGCPAAAHDAVDVWLSPGELMNGLGERGILPTAQPTEYDSVLPPDRRRFFSEPGGVPSRQALRQLGTAFDVVEIKGEDLVVDLAQHLLSPTRALIDVATSLGCCCSGAVGSVGVDTARARVREQEPPRAPSPVVDHSLPLALDGSAAHTARSEPPVAEPPKHTIATRPETSSAPVPVAVETTPRRRSPPGLSRPVLGTMPQTRTEAGRQLPRAYVARRRSSPREMRESTVSRQEPPTAPRWHWTDQRSMWLLAGLGGIAIGIGIAWFLR